MCIHVENSKPLIADKDIPIRKMLLYDKMSCEYRTPYTLHKVNLDDFQRPEGYGEPILTTFFGYGYRYCISDGFVFCYSSYGEINRISVPYSFDECYIFYGYIPKGTEYYINCGIHSDSAAAIAAKEIFISNKPYIKTSNKTERHWREESYYVIDFSSQLPID